MPSPYRYLGYGFVVTLILIAGVMIGAVLYETHISKAEPDDFWIRWQAIVGSFGVLAAIGVAIFTDLKVDKRFQKQIETQTKLDQRADERQQAEWSRQQQDRLFQDLVRQQRIMNSLIAEIYSIQDQIQRASKKVNSVTDMLPITIRIPVYNTLKKKPWMLPAEFIHVDAVPALLKHLGALNSKIEHNRHLMDVPKYLRKCDAILVITADLILDLEGMAEEIQNEIERALEPKD